MRKDTDLEDFFEQARLERPVPSADLLMRIEADAIRHLPVRPTFWDKAKHWISRPVVWPAPAALAALVLVAVFQSTPGEYQPVDFFLDYEKEVAMESFVIELIEAHGL